MIYITLINCAIVTDCVYDCNGTLIVLQKRNIFGFVLQSSNITDLNS